MFDCHMHTKLSTDSIMDAHEACEAAIKHGLLGIAFTDHHDMDFPEMMIPGALISISISKIFLKSSMNIKTGLRS